MQTLHSISNRIRHAFPYQPTNEQEQLINMLAEFVISSDRASLFLLKGYAGTGKTTIISALVETLGDLGNIPVLLAPTGRAAKVLSSYAGQTASTIHKKIYRLQNSSDGVTRLSLQTNKHKHTFFITDEASLIQTTGSDRSFQNDGINILTDLIHYVYSGHLCRLILIGDTAQLPPVKMLESHALDPAYLARNYHLGIVSFELTEVVRQARESGILLNATRLRHLIQHKEQAYPAFTISGFTDFSRLHYEDVQDAINMAYDSRNSGQAIVICRSNKRAYLYNREIRQRVLYLEDEISSGDVLMVVKNNYYWLPDDSQAGFIANGDMMEVKKIHKIQEMYGHRFADLTIALTDYPDEPTFDVKVMLSTLDMDGPSLDSQQYKQFYMLIQEDYMHIANNNTRHAKMMEDPYLQALQIKYAYAITCHKAQGGQWENVFVDMGYIAGEAPDTAYLRWLYTAITRATKKLFLLNFSDQFFE